MAKGKVVSVPAMKAYRGSGGTAPIIINLTLDKGEWSAPCPSYFTPGDSPQYPLNSWLHGPDSQ
jgi:hypothetical protein